MCEHEAISDKGEIICKKCGLIINPEFVSDVVYAWDEKRQKEFHNFLYKRKFFTNISKGDITFNKKIKLKGKFFRLAKIHKIITMLDTDIFYRNKLFSLYFSILKTPKKAQEMFYLYYKKLKTMRFTRGHSLELLFSALMFKLYRKGLQPYSLKELKELTNVEEKEIYKLYNRINKRLGETDYEFKKENREFILEKKLNFLFEQFSIPNHLKENALRIARELSISGECSGKSPLRMSLVILRDLGLEKRQLIEICDKLKYSRYVVLNSKSILPKQELVVNENG